MARRQHDEQRIVAFAAASRNTGFQRGPRPYRITRDARALRYGPQPALVCATRPAIGANLTLVICRSETSDRGNHPSRRGNKILRPTTFLSAIAVRRTTQYRAYHDVDSPVQVPYLGASHTSAKPLLRSAREAS